jgi:hypothetical protein
MHVAINSPQEAPGSYAMRLSDVLEHWCLLCGDASPARGTVTLLRAAFAGRAGTEDRRSPARLCADGSPLEFCERLSDTPQRPACTVDFGPPASKPLARLRTAFAWLEAGSAARTLAQRRFAASCADLVRAVYIGLEGNALEAVRLYIDIARDDERHDGRTSVELAQAAVQHPLASRTLSALEFIARIGRLRLCGIDLGAPAGGVKLAFALPLDEAALSRCADTCDVDMAPIRTYLRALDRTGSAWRQVRSGLGVAVDCAGRIEALTLYTYAAPYFRSDAALRETALAMASTFRWDAAGYRGASRLLDDPAGTRVRGLIGFTARRDGRTGLRMYGRSGHLV